jgi:hypothetical protein
MSEPYCAACRYWRPYLGEGSPVRYGDCRRRAPVPVERSLFQIENLKAVWPTTEASDGCGEFVPARPARGAP